MTKTIEKGSTNVSVEIYIVDSTTGQPELGVVFDTAGIDLNYRRDGAVVTSITEIDLTSPSLTDAHEDGGFLEIANGRYRLDVPDAAFASGVGQVTVGGTVTGMVVIPMVIDLVDTDKKLDRNADLAASERGYHTWQGDVYYWDPVNGNDVTGDGSRALPYATPQAVEDDLVTDSNHDVVIGLAGASGQTTYTASAATVLNKRYTFWRNVGRDMIWTRTGNGNTIEITGDGIEISGLQIGTAGTGSGNGIDITGADFIRVHGCWILDTQGDGIRILRGSNCQIHDNHFEGTGVAASGQGIHIVGTAGVSSDNVIHSNHFANTAGDSILIEDGTTNDTEVHHNTIHDSGAWGVNIGASSNYAQVHSNIFGNNASGDINDNGATTIAVNNEQWGTASALAVVAADLPVQPTKNVALANFPFLMVLTSDHVTGATGLTVTAQRSIDDGAFANCANSVVENANGAYRIDLAASDMNGNTIMLKFTAATADARFISIVTQPT